MLLVPAVLVASTLADVKVEHPQVVPPPSRAMLPDAAVMFEATAT